MYRISIYYPGPPTAKFDFEYYRTKHFPFVMKLLQPFSAERFEIDRGVAGENGGPAEYLAIGYLYVRDLKQFQRGMEKHGAEINADIPLYTDIEPRLQISEVVG